MQIPPRLRRANEWFEVGWNLKTLVAFGGSVLAVAGGLAVNVLAASPPVVRFLALFGIGVMALAAILALPKGIRWLFATTPPPKPDGPVQGWEAQSPRYFSPVAERRLVDAFKGLRNKESVASLSYSGPEQRRSLDALLSILQKSSWNARYSERSMEEDGAAPHLGTQVSGANGSLAAAVARALSDAGFPEVGVRPEARNPRDPMDLNTVQIILGHPRT